MTLEDLNGLRTQYIFELGESTYERWLLNNRLSQVDDNIERIISDLKLIEAKIEQSAEIQISNKKSAD